MESERPDALFRDPYARKLAGERGERIIASMRRGRAWAWPMIVRTAVLDELILRTIEREGVDTVLNLAAGLDTRPYRLPLPSSLRWVEADFPDVIAYKRGRPEPPVPVRARGGLAIVRGAGLAGSGIPLDVGGVAPAQTVDAARVVVEPDRTAVSQIQAGAVPAHVRHRPARAHLTPKGSS